MTKKKGGYNNNHETISTPNNNFIETNTKKQITSDVKTINDKYLNDMVWILWEILLTIYADVQYIFLRSERPLLG